MSAKDKSERRLRCYGNVFAVWFRSSRWRKAPECELHIQNLICSIEVHRRRRVTMAKQSRSDIAQLRHSGCFSETLSKTKQFYEDEKRLLAYDQVEYFCKSLLKDFSPFQHQSDVHLLPEETKEAMAGLIFAASRIGELKELQHIRSLFFERFGLDFDKDCVDLRPGNLVSSEIVNILDEKVPQDAISPNVVIDIFQRDQTNITTNYVDSSEDSASSSHLGIDDSDAVKIEELKSVIRKTNVMKENLKFMHPNLGESQGRDRSSFMR